VGSILYGQPLLTHKITSLLVEHALVPGTDSDSVDLVKGQFCDVIELDEIGISEDVLLVLDVIFLGGIEGGADWWSVPERNRFAELSTGLCVLIELCHFYNLNLYTKICFKIDRIQIINTMHFLINHFFILSNCKTSTQFYKI